MFAILSEVVAIQANELKELPVKVAREELRDWAQLEPRHRLARATHRIAVLTEGVLAMQTTCAVRSRYPDRWVTPLNLHCSR